MIWAIEKHNILRKAKSNKAYADGYSYALYNNKIITKKQFEEVRKEYWRLGK